VWIREGEGLVRYGRDGFGMGTKKGKRKDRGKLAIDDEYDGPYMGGLDRKWDTDMRSATGRLRLNWFVKHV